MWQKALAIPINALAASSKTFSEISAQSRYAHDSFRNKLVTQLTSLAKLTQTEQSKCF
jgi:hypothetical protein